MYQAPCLTVWVWQRRKDILTKGWFNELKISQSNLIAVVKFIYEKIFLFLCHRPQRNLIFLSILFDTLSQCALFMPFFLHIFFTTNWNVIFPCNKQKNGLSQWLSATNKSNLSCSDAVRQKYWNKYPISLLHVKKELKKKLKTNIL